MKQFKDSAGRAWEFAININAIRRVKDKLELDLYALLDDRLEKLNALINDPLRFCDVMFVLCREAGATKEVSDEEFGKAWSGDVWEAAADAFVEELVDFFRDREARSKLKSLLAKSKEVKTALLNKFAAKLSAIDADSAAEQVLRNLERTSSGSSGSSPASSASTPAPSP